MDASRFDAMTRSLTGDSTRRTLLGLLLGASSATLGVADAGAKKCKKPCGPCKRCRRGRCRRKPNGTDCGGGNVCCRGKCLECCVSADCDIAAGEECLLNGSCAKRCTQGGTECAPPCGCSLPNEEGTRHCIANLQACPTRTCSSTAECPLGQQCQDCLAGEPVCFPLCGS